MICNKSLIAEKTGLSRQAVTNILNGKQKNPKIQSLEKIAEVLNCTVDELITKIKTT